MNRVLEARSGLRGHQRADNGMVALLPDRDYIGLAVFAVDHDMAAPDGVAMFQGMRPDSLVRHQAVQTFSVLVPDGRGRCPISEEEGDVHRRFGLQVVDNRRLFRDVEVHAPPDVAVLPPLVIAVALAGVERHGRHGRRTQIALFLVVQCGTKLRQTQKEGSRREDNQRKAVDEQEFCFQFHRLSFVRTLTLMLIRTLVSLNSPFSAFTAMSRPSCPIFSGVCCIVA